jgi:hypothetical protein
MTGSIFFFSLDNQDLNFAKRLNVLYFISNLLMSVLVSG